MDSNSTVGAELRALGRKWERLTEVPESPRSLMNVIEYSLGSQRKAEVYVNRLLRYFLDPEEPHGMGTEFLRAFLDALPDDCGFREGIYDLSAVSVDDQVSVTEVADGTTTSTGIVDLVIEVPNEWFLVIELKFSAKDTQTEFYYRDATAVGGRPKADYESGTYYLYVHQQDEPEANEPNFANWTWSALSNEVLEPFLVANASRFPQRTVAQLHEFNDDIGTISGMTDHEENEREKVALYLDHYEAITDVSEAFDQAWERFTDEWGTRLGDRLEEDGSCSYSNPQEHVTAVEIDRQSSTRGTWNFRSSSSDWGMIFKDGWWRHTDDLAGMRRSRPDDRSDVRIGFHHRLGRNRDLAIEARTLKIYFRNMGANDQSFIDSFSNAFDEREAEIAALLPDSAEVTGYKKDKLVATYDIEAGTHEDFFAAYTAALKRAFLDLVVANEDLIEVIDEAFSESIAEVYDVSVDS
jgi:hypothetical protein